MSSAASTLTRIYTDRAIQSSGAPLVGVTSNTVPWELLRAAGYHPVLLSPRAGKRHSPIATWKMYFSARMKAIFDFLISPDAGIRAR